MGVLVILTHPSDLRSATFPIREGKRAFSEREGGPLAVDESEPLLSGEVDLPKAKTERLRKKELIFYLDSAKLDL